jgi:hypothetical protein
LRTLDGLPTMVAAFTTDVPSLTNWGEPLLLGPGSIHVAHTEGEFVEDATGGSGGDLLLDGEGTYYLALSSQFYVDVTSILTNTWLSLATPTLQ